MPQKRRFGIKESSGRDTFGLDMTQGPGLPQSPSSRGGNRRPADDPAPPTGGGGSTGDPECFTEICTHTKLKSVDYSYIALERQNGGISRMDPYYELPWANQAQISVNNPLFKFTGDWTGFPQQNQGYLNFMPPDPSFGEWYERFFGPVAPSVHFTLNFHCKQDILFATNPPYNSPQNPEARSCCPETPSCRMGWDNNTQHNDFEESMISPACHCCDDTPGPSLGEIKREIISTHDDINNIQDQFGNPRSVRLPGVYIDLVKYTISMSCHHVWRHYKFGKYPGPGPPDCPQRHTLGGIALTGGTGRITDQNDTYIFPVATGNAGFNYKLKDAVFPVLDEDNPVPCAEACTLKPFVAELGTVAGGYGTDPPPFGNKTDESDTGDLMMKLCEINWPFKDYHRFTRPSESKLCEFIRDSYSVDLLGDLMFNNNGPFSEDYNWCDLCNCDDPESFMPTTQRCCKDQVESAGQSVSFP